MDDAMGDKSDIAIDCVGVSKRFRFRTAAAPPTLKDLVVRRVRFESGYGIVDALDDVTFSVDHGHSIGVIGENGSGKSTLLRVLAGITRPDRGTVTTRGRIATLLALGAGFNPYLTGRENALIELLTLGLGHTEAKRLVSWVIDFSELQEFADLPVRTYSTGMTMRLAFAAAICVDPDILLIDEVLAVGDERFSAKCEAWLENFKQRGKTTVLASHDAATIAAQCDTALWLDNGRIAAFGERLSVIRAYTQAKRGRPVSDVASRTNGSVDSDAALADVYRNRIIALLPMLRVPIIGHVRQKGHVKGLYEDGWTDGELEFTIEPVRDVVDWTVHATVPGGIPKGTKIAVMANGVAAATADATPGHVTLQCNVPLAKGTLTNVRITSSSTVNHEKLGISQDVRDVGLRVDEIDFQH